MQDPVWCRLTCQRPYAVRVRLSDTSVPFASGHRRRLRKIRARASRWAYTPTYTHPPCRWLNWTRAHTCAFECVTLLVRVDVNGYVWCLTWAYVHWPPPPPDQSYYVMMYWRCMRTHKQSDAFVLAVYHDFAQGFSRAHYDCAHTCVEFATISLPPTIADTQANVHTRSLFNTQTVTCSEVVATTQCMRRRRRRRRSECLC